MRNNKISKIALTGMFSALASILMIYGKIYIFPSFKFLSYDFSDIPALIAALFIGPFYGIMVLLIKNIFDLLVYGLGNTLGIGNIMNFIVGVAFVIPFTLIYKKLSAKCVRAVINYLIASVISIISILAIGALANLYFAPLYLRIFTDTVMSEEFLYNYVFWVSMLNIIKGIITSIAGIIIIISFKKIKLFKDI